jgi:hypothetical protein
MRKLNGKLCYRKLHVVLVLLVLLGANPKSVSAQQGSSGSAVTLPQHKTNYPTNVGYADEQITAQRDQMNAKFAAARRKEIGADTQRLLQLIQEFQAEVSKSDNYANSFIGIKKITEIEKLAKHLKKKMTAE